MYNSQFNQDRWVNEFLRGKTDGLFIDIGGCRPVKTNNTYFFEKEKNWFGVIVEANPKIVMELARNRKARILNDAIWYESGLSLEFTVLNNHYSLSTALMDCDDEHKEKRSEDGKTIYHLNTITISKIIDDYFFDSDGYVDYISLDVEGAEYNALLGLDQTRHEFGCLTVEHNGNIENRQLIHDLLSDNYIRLTDVERLEYFQYGDEQHQKWFWNEDWYVNKDLKK